MGGSLLPIPAGSAVQGCIEGFTATWNDGRWSQLAYPRSAWLGAVEAALQWFYPKASSDDLTLTARSVAPFPLAAGKDVP